MAGAVASARTASEVRKARLWKKVLPYLFIAPSLVIFFSFDLYPILYSFYLSFMKWNLLNPVKTFVGLDNYRTLLSAEDFRMALGHTLIFTAGRVGLSLTIALAFALLLNTKSGWARWTQAAIFSPHVISMVSVSMLWLWLMDPSFGLLNWFLGLFGIPPLKWLAATSTSLMSVILVAVWKAIGYDMIIIIAGLQSISEEIYEAAKIDGANAWQRFKSITLPMLSPTMFFLVVTSTISSFQVFDSVKVMTAGGPADSTTVLVYYIYQYGFQFFKVGYASAASMVLLGLVLVVTLLQFTFLERKVHYD
ncbi:MAG TPA: sugar ABC transporter permease [Symbiobacteriaceae bacterium]|nr:sugar ABC transporter permease [Symbiobacteriaceae bacterium]